MHEQDKAMIRALVPVAWADGVFAESEQQTLEALLDAFGATDADKAELRAFAAEKKTLEDIDLQQLSADDRRALLQHATLMSWVDGSQGPEEIALLDAFVSRLKIPADEGKQIIAMAAERAKRHLGLLS